LPIDEIAFIHRLEFSLSKVCAKKIFFGERKLSKQIILYKTIGYQYCW